MFALRRAPLAVSRARAFHSSARSLIAVGSALPNLEVLQEDSPGNKVNLSKEIVDRAVVIGVPAAFSPSCSNSHIPGYINHPKLKGAGDVFVVSVNDAFVMKAWKDNLDPTGTSGIRFLADPTAEYTKALELDFDAPAIFGGPRSKRYALLVEDGKVKETFVEEDNTGLKVSTAENVLGN